MKSTTVSLGLALFLGLSTTLVACNQGQEGTDTIEEPGTPGTTEPGTTVPEGSEGVEGGEGGEGGEG